MGLAASQARLLSITARIHDVEYEAQQVQNAKLQLAVREDSVYQKYMDALDAQTLTFKNDEGKNIAATFENLCGLSSINNGMNKNFIFRTNDSKNFGDDDKLIVSDDVYNAYKKYPGNNPYEFAMHMVGADIENINLDDNTSIYDRYIDPNGDKELNELKDRIYEEFEKNILVHTTNYDAEGTNNNDPSAIQDNKEKFKDMLDANFNIYDVAQFFDNEEIPSDVDKYLMDEFEPLLQEFQHKFYTRYGSDIYNDATFSDNKTEFNDVSAEFNYYLHQAQLIENEGGIEYCVPYSDYSTNSNNSEFFTQMVQTGRIIIDEVSFKNGRVVNGGATSVGSNSRLDYTNTSDIDSTALKKAEAQYENDMRQINKADKKYDLELSRLETERTALTTEYDSVKKVIQDNTERTFKIFS